jgi:biopolymer transport protein ExbB
MNFKTILVMAAAVLLAVGVFVQTSIGEGAPPAPAGSEAPPAAGGDAPETGDEEIQEQAAPMSFSERLNSMWIWLTIKWEEGGPTMYGLAFVGLVGVVFMLDRIFGLRRGRFVPRGLATRANQLWQDGRHDDILALTRRSRSALSEIIAFIVEHRSSSYDSITSAAEDIANRHFEQQERRNYPLAAVGSLSPLLGLMGTIFGLMGAFSSIKLVGSMDDPSALAGNIGEAMVTTATGLIIAVPVLGVYHYFTSRTSQFASLLGQEVSNLMHEWFLKSKGN